MTTSQTTPTKIEIYTLQEVADTLRVSYVYTTQLVKEGKIQAIKVGKRKVVTRQALEDYLERNKL